MTGLSRVKERAAKATVPRGAIWMLCALVLAPPAGLALGHGPNRDGQGRLIHHHTLDYTTCNEINENQLLKKNADTARENWDDATLLGLTYQEQCHPAGDDSGKVHLQLQDARLGNTGWRASSIHNANSETNSAYHARHTHIQFNLDGGFGQYSGYDFRALACREIGMVIGLKRLPVGDRTTHGADNDCMSFGGVPNDQVSKDENPNAYTYTAQPGPHSVQLVDDEYSSHGIVAPELSVGGPLRDAAQTTLTDDYYELWIEASSIAGMQSIEVLVDGVRATIAQEPCSQDNDLCAKDLVFEFTPDNYSLGAHQVRIVATDAAGRTTADQFVVQVGTPSTPGDESFTETPPPSEGTGPGCTPFGVRPVEEGTVAVAHGSWSGGFETTQYFDSGSYEVARCDSQGRFMVMQAVDTIDASGQAVRIVESETTPVGGPASGDFEFRAWRALYPDPEGSAPNFWTEASQGAIPPTPTALPRAAEPSPLSHLPDRGCSTKPFALNYRWTFTPRYRIHLPSLPHGGRTSRRIQDSHRVWNKTSDDCGRPNRTSFRMIFDGRAASRAELGDDRDTVDFGQIQGCPSLSVGCARSTGFSSGGGRVPIVGEVDIRFNEAPKFSNGQPAGWYSGLDHRVPSGKYDVFSVGAHEAGHKVGLDHVSKRAHQTLTPGLGGDSRRRTLGLGDVLGLEKLYRGRNLPDDPR